MIQEKDFLYRVPVKTAPITTPRGQIRNPEILVDLEGGEFMHGNILDANSTNKLINQSVKDAVDDKFIESGYVTKDLLEAETSARTKGDEDLGTKIKAEQTRAEGKEKEISDKLAIVDGDSNTEGSFRKAIADVIAAAPEDLDTLKEIADKLAGNDDLHTALNQAITEKADASALANEVTRATGAESGLQAAINAKQDAGSYIPCDPSVINTYQTNRHIGVKLDDANTAIFGPNNCIRLKSGDENTLAICYAGLELKNGDNAFSLNPDGIKQVGGQYAFNVNASEGVKFSRGQSFAQITPFGFYSNQMDSEFVEYNTNDFIHIKSQNNQIVRVQPTFLHCSCGTSSIDINSASIQLTNDGDTIRLDSSGIALSDGSYDYVLTSNGSTINIKNYATQNDLNSQLGPKADRSDLITLEQKITANTTAIEGKQDEGNYVTYGSEDCDNYYFHKGFTSTEPFVVENSHGNEVEYGINGITSSNHSNCLATSDGTFKPISDFASAGDVSSLRVGLSKKQDKITVNEVDITDIETADITKLRTIVTNLINALSASNLIRETISIE